MDAKECPWTHDARHEWLECTTYEGDPSVPNGTNLITYYKCIWCDEEAQYLQDDDKRYEPDEP